MAVSLRRASLFAIASLVLLLGGLVLPGVGATIAEQERERAERQVSVDCEVEFIGEPETAANGSIQKGPATTDCFEKQQRAVQREQRDWVILGARVLFVGGWALRLGGVVWVGLALRAVYHALR